MQGVFSSFRRALWLFLISATLTSTASAQEATYRFRTSASFGGAMDQVMALAQRFGAGSMESEETRYIKGNRMRTDSDQSSTIMDMQQRRMLVLDHERRTYMEISLDDMMAMAGDVTAGTGQAAGDAGEQVEEDPEAVQADVTYSVSVDPTGETARIAGYEAQQFLITLEAEIRAVAEDERDEEQEMRGRIGAVTDMWVSDEAPRMQLDMNDFPGAEAMAEDARASGNAMSGFFTQNPESQAAFEQAAAEMAKIEGTPLRTTTYLVLVPSDQELDRDAVLSGSGDEEEEDRGGSAMDALRGMAGLFGGGRDETDPEEATVGQTTIMTLSEEAVDVDSGPIADSMFEIPEGYTPLAFPGAGG